MPSISLCMIVRDEEVYIDTCLRSASSIVDEICVLDTGSVDRTVEIARSHGALVSPFKWSDDFAAARNAAIAMAKCDWILMLDADERVGSEDARDKLLAFAAAHPGVPGHVTIVDELDDGEIRSSVTRFFPRAGEPNFRGRIHEQLYFGDDYPARESTEIEVRHVGYRPEVLATRDKLARNEGYLECELQEHPEDAYLWYQLGRNHLVAHDYEKALDAFTSALDNVETDAAYLAPLFEHTGQCLRALEKSLEALSLLRQVSGAYRDRPDMVYLEAQLALDTGLLEDAEVGFQRCLQLGEQRAKNGRGVSAKVASTWGPCYHLALLRECLGMKTEARAYYKRALALHPSHVESSAGLERLEESTGGGSSER
ncbi:MAG: glycosyltransferase [bacterium]|nr:glycosyltransferase [bacterium]